MHIHFARAILDVQFCTSKFGCAFLNIKNYTCKMDVHFWTFKIGCAFLDIQKWMCIFAHPKMDVHFWSSKYGCTFLNIQKSIPLQISSLLLIYEVNYHVQTSKIFSPFLRSATSIRHLRLETSVDL